MICCGILLILLMFHIFAAFLKVIHVALISYICLLICTPNPKVPQDVFLLELSLTIISILITKRHFLDIFQVILTLNLSYALIPNNYPFISGLYFFKIVFIYNALGEVLDDLFQSPQISLTLFLKCLVGIVRYTLAEYLFLGLVMLGYKIFTLGDQEGSLPEDYLILYKLIVTATTIGYGDVTPKTKLQVLYFTYAIPFICVSFVFYINAVLPIIAQLVDFVSGNSTIRIEQERKEELYLSKAWSSNQKDSFVNFVEEVSKRQAQNEQINKRLGYNWIAISANHYERQIPLISSILLGDQEKQMKLKVSSKIRRQYYPKGWTILQAGDTSEDLMMVDQGDVRTPSLKAKGYVFNKQGFQSKSPSKETIVANTFVSIWAISIRDLQELGRSSSKIQKILRQGIQF